MASSFGSDFDIVELTLTTWSPTPLYNPDQPYPLHSAVPSLVRAFDVRRHSNFPTFPIDKTMDVVEQYKGSVGLQVVFAPLDMDARLQEACLKPNGNQLAAVWGSAKVTKDLLLEQSVCYVPQSV
jgi:hypothetical protein